VYTVHSVQHESLTLQALTRFDSAADHRRRLVINIGGRANQKLGTGVNPGGNRVPSDFGVRGSQTIIISYNVQEYDENTENGSK